jgi:uncharacterized cupin superfamily protein
MGGSLAIRLRARDTGGRLGLVEQVVPPGLPGPALHVHPEFDESFVVIEGELAFRIGEAAHTAGPGTLAFIRRGVAHTFANPTASPVTTLVWFTPAGSRSTSRR